MKHLYIFLLYSVLLISCRSASFIKVNQYEASQITIDSTIAADPTMEAFISPYRNKLDSQMNHVIGRNQQALIRSPRQGENLGGIFFADVLLALGKRLDDRVVCSVGTKDGIRTELAAGDITIGSVFELMPFENYVTVLEITGEQLLALGEFIAETEGQPIAGMRITIKDKKIVDLTVDGAPVDTAKTYKIATYDYLANGGDFTRGLENPVNRIDSNIRLREGIISYIQQLTEQGKQIKVNLDGRVKIIQ